MRCRRFKSPRASNKRAVRRGASEAAHASPSTPRPPRRRSDVDQRQITVHVQQIATKRQVVKKNGDISQFRRQRRSNRTPAHVRTHLPVQARPHPVRLTGVQAQPVRVRARGGVRVAVDVPDFGVILIATSRVVRSSRTVTTPSQGRYASDEEYFKLMGYVAEDQSVAAEGTTAGDD